MDNAATHRTVRSEDAPSSGSTPRLDRLRRLLRVTLVGLLAAGYLGYTVLDRALRTARTVLRAGADRARPVLWRCADGIRRRFRHHWPRLRDRAEPAARWLHRHSEPALRQLRRSRAYRAAAPVVRRTAVRATDLARRLAAAPPVRGVLRRPARFVVAAAVAGCLIMLSVGTGGVDSPPSAAEPDDRVAVVDADRAAGAGASRDGHAPAADPDLTAPKRRDRDADRDRGGDPLTDAPPVAGLSPVQMDNARAIVRTGRDMGMPRRALIIGVATAMQESNLLNRASEVLPESKKYPHQGTGWDHDSVGLFQQRTSTGWGPVDRLMDPAYATARFFEALRQVPGWERMRLTDAAQAVQVSAYPEHYAKHEDEATAVVDALAPDLR